MRTLKESLLDDIETTITLGTDWANDMKQAMNELSKCLSTAKNYDRMSKIYKNGRCTKFLVIPDLFSMIGLDANKIEIVAYQTDDELNNASDWHLNIFINKRDAYNKLISSAYDTSVYLYDGVFSTFNDILKKLIKPMTKDIETFKHTLEKLKNYDGQLITQPNEILK